MGKGVLLRNVLREMEKQHPFTLSFITCDVNRKKGGDVKTLNNCKRVGQAHDMSKNQTIGVLEDGADHPIAVHIRLITEFNGQEVFW